MENWLDLRSDTVTRPSAAMRAAMNTAEVGDDVYGDDPTVNRLQEYAADLFGFEDALFAPSGTQSNLLALLAHCGRGDEYLVGQEAHTYRYEGGGAAVLGSIQPQPIVNQADGSIALADIESYIKPDDFHFARTRLLALENTINGRVLPMDYVQQATKLAHDKGLATHLDGARVCNAAVKLGITPREVVQGFDSVSVCLSKGLGAPVGSVLLGSRPLIREAKRWRKMLGGGMRQAGVIAAGGLYALEHNIPGLAEDHDNAAYFAAELAKMRNLKVSAPQTNIFYVDIPQFVLKGLGDVLELTRIRMSLGPRTRIVTHMDASREDIDRAITVFGDFFG
ncbi:MULTISPECIES: low-specificity L-threonine aldolase [unclassified Duganella]|jgi:threonine aldolase|uniref:low-specificity L-threonine aldolase n=1 Tax=unclassified Duganella TaxID=2636909 RepID=UPI00088E5F11|nr:MULTISPECIES: low-specificity L-threonine aldolase [unclassified Duganella]SDF47059.1 L-threonine aldolase [Duganella sp. OV458]SDI79734.1 L-threonine aldolase [Duganella sp. OV510]